MPLSSRTEDWKWVTCKRLIRSQGPHKVLSIEIMIIKPREGIDVNSGSEKLLIAEHEGFTLRDLVSLFPLN